MKIKFKKLDKNAVTPRQGREGDACWDLVATSRNMRSDYIEYGTGIAIEIPEDYVGLVFPRSSVTNMNMMLKNAVGIIDSTYRGEIKLRFLDLAMTNSQTSASHLVYTVGDRIGQIMVIPRPFLEFEEVDELDETVRADGGFGSSGR